MKTYTIYVNGQRGQRFENTESAYARYESLRELFGDEYTIALVWDPTGEVVACSDDWDDYNNSYAPTKEDMEEIIL